jgi:hypothetical protein
VAEIATHEADGKPLEIWFADEARVGQKNKLTRRWAKRGTRPSAPRDLRTASAYIFGAICPAQGKGAGLVLPRCTTEAMALHLAEIAQDGVMPACEMHVSDCSQTLGHELSSSAQRRLQLRASTILAQPLSGALLGNRHVGLTGEHSKIVRLTRKASKPSGP